MLLREPANKLMVTAKFINPKYAYVHLLYQSTLPMLVLQLIGEDRAGEECVRAARKVVDGPADLWQASVQKSRSHLHILR
jgi:hypothetical protein